MPYTRQTLLSAHRRASWRLLRCCGPRMTYRTCAMQPCTDGAHAQGQGGVRRRVLAQGGRPAPRALGASSRPRAPALENLSTQAERAGARAGAGAAAHLLSMSLAVDGAHAATAGARLEWHAADAVEVDGHVKVLAFAAFDVAKRSSAPHLLRRVAKLPQPKPRHVHASVWLRASLKSGGSSKQQNAGAAAKATAAGEQVRTGARHAR